MKYSEYAELCALSYQGGKPFKVMCDLSFGVFKIEGKQIVVFRGSENLENWLRDFSIWPVRSRDGYWVHQGFDGAFESLYGAVILSLDGIGNVEFTGHSLGGAIAERFAAFWCNRAVTFGAPKNYYQLCKVPLVGHDRIICDDDPVPKLRLLGRHAVNVRKELVDKDGIRLEAEDHNIEVYIKRLIDAGM